MLSGDTCLQESVAHPSPGSNCDPLDAGRLLHPFHWFLTHLHRKNELESHQDLLASMALLRQLKAEGLASLQIKSIVIEASRFRLTGQSFATRFNKARCS